MDHKFFLKVNKTDHCWLWTGARQTHRGALWHGVVRRNNKGYLAHRYSWIIHNGPIPSGLCVLHRCDMPACVNPDHLFLGTQLDNIADMMAKDRHGDQRGVRQSSAKLSEQNVLDIRLSSDRSQLLADQYLVSPATINDIRKRRTWTHI